MLLFASPSSDGAHTPAALPQLRARVLAECPALAARGSTFTPSPLLRNGHLQTLYSAAADTAHLDRVPYRRHVLLTPDGGTLTCDVTAFPRDASTAQPHDALDDVPTLFVTHGLTGGSSESYVRALLHPLCTPRAQGGHGYRAIVLNSRGCAHTPATSPQLYSASKTADVRAALLWATRTFPNSPLIGIGFSLGANFLAKAVAEDGDDTPLLSAIPIGAPWDLLRGSEALEGDGPGKNALSHTYSAVLASNLRTVIASHAATLALHTPLKPHLAALFKPLKNKTDYWQFAKSHSADSSGEYTLPTATPEGSHHVTPGTLRHVDDVLTRLVGGHSAPYGEFPLRSAKAYYLQGGAGQVRLLHNVRIPLLALNADDDPIVPLPVLAGLFEVLGERGREEYNARARQSRLPLHRAAHLAESADMRTKRHEQSSLEPSSSSSSSTAVPNENIVLAYTRGGGHLGWWTSVRNGAGPRSARWIAEPVGQWVDMLVRRVERARDAHRAEADAGGHLATVFANSGASHLSADERRERDWALRTFTRSLWARDAAAGADETSMHAPRLRTRTVSVELVDELDLPVYDFETGDFVKARASLPPVRVVPASPLRSKVPFLLTQLLDHAPLVHPKDATVGWHADPTRREPVRSGPWQQGRVIDITMHYDSQHPEVGFAELPADSQVAGVGALFDGASEVPGQSAEAAAWVRANVKKTWYKSRRKGVSPTGVVRGL